MSPAAVPPDLPHPGFQTGAVLWLVRHGHVREDWQGVAYGDLDVPLGPEGLRDTELAAESLGGSGLDAVLSSPLSRARALGQALAERAGVELEVDDALREIHRGSWQGRKVAELHEQCPDEVRAFYADPWNFDAHGGENDRAVLARVWPVVERVLRTRPTRVALAVHYNVIRVAVGRALGIPPAHTFRLRVDPGRGVMLRDGVTGWELVHSNTLGPAAEPAAAESCG